MQMYSIKVLLSRLVLAVAAASCSPVEKKPNIVMIVADDVGWNDVGFHGSNQINTPNIDALGLNGIYFDKHYAQQSCTPSRSALLTGKYPIRLGYQGMPINPGENRSISHDLWTLPKALKGLGYMNHMVGKWHLGSASKNFTPQAYGYDSHFGYLDGFISYFDHDIQSNGYLGKDIYSDYQPLTNTTGQYFTDMVTRRSIDVIRNHPQEKPLHLVISHLAAHTGKSTGDMNGVLEVASNEYNDRKYGYIPDKIRRMYAEIVERMDDSIGEVVDALDRKGILNNTIIVFFSDNGAPTNGFFKNRGSNFPFRGIKLSLFEGGVRVPAVVYSPKFKNKGRIYKNLFHITDWAPTLYSAAGGDPSKLNLDGVNQWQHLVTGKTSLKEKKRDEILLNIDEVLGYSGLIKGRYKLINGTFHDETFNNYTGEVYVNRPYDINKVLKSKTNEALGNLKQEKDLLTLRKKMTLPNCRPKTDGLKCPGVCLFDLERDPCESKDISKKLPFITKNLWNRLQVYNDERKPQLNRPVDPASNPQYCNGFWFPWLDEDGCWFDSHQM